MIAGRISNYGLCWLVFALVLLTIYGSLLQWLLGELSEPSYR